MTPCAESWAMMRCDAETAAWRTAPEPSATQVRRSGRIETMYGSKRRPSVSQRHSNAYSAPSRAFDSASPFFLSSTAPCSAAITPCCLSDGIPIPLTTPARPKAAPRLLA